MVTVLLIFILLITAVLVRLIVSQLIDLKAFAACNAADPFCLGPGCFLLVLLIMCICVPMMLSFAVTFMSVIHRNR